MSQKQQQGGLDHQPVQAQEKAKKERVQIEFLPDALARLDALQTSLNAYTRTEVIRLALRLLEWLATEVPEDATITVTKDKEVIAMFKTKLLYGGVK